MARRISRAKQRDRGNRRSLPPAVLILRAVISNGGFNDYWAFHLTREHQRLYPGTAQGAVHARA